VPTKEKPAQSNDKWAVPKKSNGKWIAISIAIIGAVATIIAAVITILPIVLVAPRPFFFVPALEQAHEYLLNEDYPEALALFVEVAADDPENPLVWYGMYLALELSGLHEDAVEALEEGTRHVRRRATGGQEMRDTLAAARVSPEEGLAVAVESYRSFGFEQIALRLLQEFVRVFDGAERFVNMLVEMGTEIAAADDNTTYFEGSYYQVFDVSMTWYEAKAFAENLGGHLATITSQPEQDFIEELLVGHERYFYWLGGTNRTQSGQWEWITGEPFDEYTNWDIWQPDNYDGFEHYLHLYRVPHRYVEGSLAGRWNDLAYNKFIHYEPGAFFSRENFGFIVEWSGHATTIQMAQATDGATYFEGSYYQVFDVSMTWYEAKTFAENLGGHLVTITSQEEQEFINELLKAAPAGQYWIGLYYDSGWNWVTGEAFDFSNWSEGQPDSYGYGEPYGGTGNIDLWWITDIGRWNDYSNLSNDLGVIVEWSNATN